MICQNCNRENRDDSKFCEGCGATLIKEEVVQDVPVQEPDPIQYTQPQPQPFQNVEPEMAQNQTNNTNNTTGEPIPEYNPASAIMAIVVSVLCCTGMIGIIFAILSLVEGSKVKTFVQAGNISAAKASLADAKKWNKIAWIITGVLAGLSLIVGIFYFAAGLLSSL